MIASTTFPAGASLPSPQPSLPLSLASVPSDLPQNPMPVNTIAARLLLLRWVRARLVVGRDSWPQVSATLDARGPKGLRVGTARNYVQAASPAATASVAAHAPGQPSAVIFALRELKGVATVGDLALKVYGVANQQTRNRIGVHLAEQKRRGRVERGPKHGSWRLVEAKPKK